MFTVFILLLATAAVSSDAHSYEPSWEHFATEEANKAAPSIDLSHFGIPGGQLPKVYDLRAGNMTYMPDESLAVYRDIRAGLKNRTHIIDQRRGRVLDEKICYGVNLDLYGTCSSFEYHNSCVEAVCVNQGGCTWSQVVVYNVQSAYITFWASSACNGKKGSFNPHCNQDPQQSCQFNLHWGSFRVYAGCHQQDQSNC